MTSLPMAAIARGLLRVATALLPLLSMAAPYPDRPIELVVPFSAGTAPDVVARSLAESMGRQLGQPVVVISKAGAGGAIAYKYVQARKPDGYTLVLSSNSESVAHYSGLMPFGHEAFTPLARVSIELPVLAVRSDSPFRNLADFCAYGKQHPAELKVGSTSIGSHMHLTSLTFFRESGVEITPVPFPTSGHVTSLLGGQIDAVVTLPGSVAAQVAAGRLRILGVLGSRREPSFAEVPTAREQGHDFQSDLWRGVSGPLDMPPAIVARLQEAVRFAVESPEFRRQGELMGFQPAYLASAPFGKTVADEDVSIAQTMKRAGLLK